MSKQDFGKNDYNNRGNRPFERKGQNYNKNQNYNRNQHYNTNQHQGEDLLFNFADAKDFMVDSKKLNVKEDKVDPSIGA